MKLLQYAVLVLMCASTFLVAEKSLVFQSEHGPLRNVSVIVVGVDHVQLDAHGAFQLTEFMHDRYQVLGKQLPRAVEIVVPTNGSYATAVFSVELNDLRGDGYITYAVHKPNVVDPWFANIKGGAVTINTAAAVAAQVYCVGTADVGMILKDGRVFLTPRLERDTGTVTLVIDKLGFRTVVQTIDVTNPTKDAAGKTVVVPDITADLQLSKLHVPTITVVSTISIYDSARVVKGYMDAFGRRVFRIAYHDLVANKYYGCDVDVLTALGVPEYDGAITAQLANVSEDMFSIPTEQNGLYALDESGINWKNRQNVIAETNTRKQRAADRNEMQSDADGEFDPRLKRMIWMSILLAGILFICMIGMVLFQRRQRLLAQVHMYRGCTEMMTWIDKRLFRELCQHLSTLTAVYDTSRNAEVPQIIAAEMKQGLKGIDQISVALTRLATGEQELLAVAAELASLRRDNLAFLKDSLEADEFTFATIARDAVAAIEKQLKQNQDSLALLRQDMQSRVAAFNQMVTILRKMKKQANLSRQAAVLQSDFVTSQDEIARILSSVSSSYTHLLDEDLNQYVARDTVRQQEKLRSVTVAESKALREFLSARS